MCFLKSPEVSFKVAQAKEENKTNTQAQTKIKTKELV
jgi:hypothetical protein